MATVFRNIFYITLLTFFLCITVKAQPKKGEFIQASIGYGISTSLDELEIYGSGFYAQGEYVFGIKKWFGLRPYAGFIITSPNENTTAQDLSEFEVTAKAFLLGGKVRICAPIPWFAPYFEIGIGASIGSFKTYTPLVNIKENGLLMHIPFTLGLALGKNNEVEIAATYYFHPSIEQFSGAVAIGLSFPLY